MGPLEATKPWSMRGVEGVYRFLGRVWRLYIDDKSEQTRLGKRCIRAGMAWCSIQLGTSVARFR